jgi:hypothetical protein
MTLRYSLSIATSVLFGTLALAKPAAASLTADGGYGMGSDRFGATVAGLLALASVTIGAVSYARASGRFRMGDARIGAALALALGLTAFVLAVLHEAQSTGGFGTGNGRAGAIAAMVAAMIGVNLGGLAWARGRRGHASAAE